MHTLDVSETISAPIDRVWSTVSDLPSWPETISAIDSVRVRTDGPVGAGTVFTEVRTFGGREASETMTVAEFEPPRRMVFAAESRGMRYRSTQSLEEIEPGVTRVTIEFASEPTSLVARLVGAVMWPMMKKHAERCLADDLKDVKRAVEG